MRATLATCLLCVFAAVAHAQGDKVKPNTLTPKEIADGWILLFDGETTFGWETKGKVRVEDGMLVLPDRESTIKHTTVWHTLEVRLECRMKTPPKEDQVGGFFELLGTETAQGLARKKDWSEFHCVFEATAKPGEYNFRTRTNYELDIDLRDSRFPRAARGMYPLIVGPVSGADVQLRNIKVRPLNTTSLFNGKDLTGWNVFPNKKSKFAVIDNAINVKDGPGDLQTVGKYKDFILQLECISNGPNLNSGIFFRCRDNEYQNGYEAQIQNQFMKDPKKVPIEEYDPKTNKLLAKKEVLTNAFDYGTGAIYRRIPARKQMSKDGEWFGMTIVAHGNHLATWVNGVQVVDWTDHRPKSDNARTGCKLEAGHISIQGHDPTTDLSFRNFRIAEFK